MNDKGVYRTALSILGLLNTVDWVGRLRLKQTNCQMKKASQQRQSTSAFGSQCPSNIWGIAGGMRGNERPIARPLQPWGHTGVQWWLEV